MKLSVITFLILFFTPMAWGGSPHRVISLSPALTELIFALNLQNTLVGVSDFSDYPKAAKERPSVGPYSKPNIEKILTLKPDLVLLPVEGPEDVKKHFDDLHIPYHIVSMRTLDEIGATAEVIGQLLGREKAGKYFNKQWQGKIKKVFAASQKNNKSVFLEVQKTPLIAAGKDTFLDEIVTRCGGVNTTEETGYPHLSLEIIFKKHFDLIFLADYFANSKEREEALAWWKQHSSAKVITLDPDTASRPGPRIIQGIHKICEAMRDS